MMDFSQGAGAASSNSSEPIPRGQLAWAILNVRGVKPSRSGGAYIDAELTIDEGQPFARRKLWDMIGDPNNTGNSEAYRQMGLVAITRILEAGRNAGPNNPAGYKIADYSQLNGLRVAIKVGIEKGQDGYEDKNRVADYLTPNPASVDGHKPFLLLQQGVFNKDASPTPAPAAQGGFSGFGAPAPAATGGFPGFGGTASAPASAGGWGSAPAGNTQSGFPQPQPVVTAGWGNAPATSAGSPQPVTTDSAINAPMTSHSDPAGTPGWVANANQ